MCMLSILRDDLQRYRFNCFSSPNNTASHAVMRCYIREKARIGEGVIHFHQPAYRLTGGKRVEPFTPYPYPAKLHISQGRALSFVKHSDSTELREVQACYHQVGRLCIARSDISAQKVDDGEWVYYKSCS